MIEDVSNQMRLRITKAASDTIQIVPHNYYRNIGYAGSLNNLVLNYPISIILAIFTVLKNIKLLNDL